MAEMQKQNYQSITEATILEINKTDSSETTSKYTSSSKVYQFRDLPEPKNATEGNKFIILIVFNNIIYL